MINQTIIYFPLTAEQLHITFRKKEKELEEKHLFNSFEKVFACEKERVGVKSFYVCLHVCAYMLGTPLSM